MAASKAWFPRRDERRPAVFVEGGGDDEAPTLGLWDCDLDRVLEDVDARDGVAVQRLEIRACLVIHDSIVHELLSGAITENA